MATVSELADDVIHDTTPAVLRDVDAPDVHHCEDDPALVVSACPDDALFQSASPAHSRDRFRRAIRTMVKPLIAMATAQYVIVTVLVAFAAITVAQHAAHLINEKVAAVTLALKRF